MTASASNQIAELVCVAYRHYSASLLRRLLKKLPSQQDADDVCQEIFLRFLRVNDVAAIRDPLRYLHTIATHTLAEFHAAREPAADLVTEVDQIAGENTIEEEADREILAARVTAALRAMPPAHRSAVLCCKFKGMTYEEAAREMGTSVHKVERYLAAGIKHLNTMRLDD